jgi:hypothetical protein
MLVQDSPRAGKMDWFWESEDEARSTFPGVGSSFEQVTKSMSLGSITMSVLMEVLQCPKP